MRIDLAYEALAGAIGIGFGLRVAPRAGTRTPAVTDAARTGTPVARLLPLA